MSNNSSTITVFTPSIAETNRKRFTDIFEKGTFIPCLKFTSDLVSIGENPDNLFEIIISGSQNGDGIGYGVVRGEINSAKPHRVYVNDNKNGKSTYEKIDETYVGMLDIDSGNYPIGMNPIDNSTECGEYVVKSLGLPLSAEYLVQFSSSSHLFTTDSIGNKIFPIKTHIFFLTDDPVKIKTYVNYPR